MKNKLKLHFLLKAITTPTELAKLIDRDISVASRILNGKKPPTKEQIGIIVKTFPEHFTYEMFYDNPKK